MDSMLQSITLSAPRKKKNRNAAYQNPFDVIDEVDVSCDHLWNDLNEKLQGIQHNLLKKIVTDITTYLTSYQYTDLCIPALTLLTGINVSDHDELFQLIKQEVKSFTKYPVVFIRSSHDTSVKPVIERMVQSFVSSNQPSKSVHEATDSETSEDEEENAGKKMKKTECTLTRLYLWYKSKRTDENDQSPLIVVIPEVESFSRKVLNDFFSNLSIYKNRMPFILILGVATDMNALHQRILHSVLQKFQVVIFKSKPPLEFLDLVLEKIFLTADCPFQLHGKILDHLIEAFTFYNYSVEYFVRGIHFCVVNHFLKSDCNVLCCSIDEIPQVIQTLDQEHLNDLLQLPSVGILNTSRRNQKLPLLNKKNIRTELLTCMKDLRQRLVRFHVAVRCFHVIVKSVSGSFFNKKLRNIYCQAMQTNITKESIFKDCMTQVKFLSSERVLNNIDAMEKLLLPYISDPVIATKLEELLSFRHAIESLISDSVSPRKRKMSPISVSNSPEKSAKNIPNDSHEIPVVAPTSRSDWKKNLRENASNQKRTMSDWERQKHNLVEFLSTTFFGELLECPTNYPFHEVLLYKDHEYVKKHYTSVNQRNEIEKALFNPQTILKCKCCKMKTQDDFPETMPDLCIAYRLYLEQEGKNIDLKSWLDGFDSKVSGMKANDEEEENVITVEVYNRFKQTVKELQLFGFIEPHKRNPDYVKNVDFVQNMK